jgi:uncharacterized membrane protein YhaH (DUF805 family)
MAYCIQCGDETRGDSAFCVTCDPVVVRPATIDEAVKVIPSASELLPAPVDRARSAAPGDSFFGSYFEAWLKVLDMSGRARRREYGLFVLVNLFLSLAAMFAAVLGVIVLDLPDSSYYEFALFVQLAYGIICIPVTVRRFHDLGDSGWMIWRRAIPLIGIYYELTLFFMDGQDFENEYGPSPKGRRLPLGRWSPPAPDGTYR